MDERSYHLGPLALQLQIDCAIQHQRLIKLWEQLFRLTPQPVSGVTTALLPLRLTTVSTPPPAWLLTTPSTVQFGAVALWRMDGGFQLRCGESWLAITPVGATGYLAADFWQQGLVTQRDFWQRVFFFMARWANHHFLHANALLPPGDAPAVGVLLVGDCGSGKTTLTMSLLAAGWRYVTDDSVLLQLTPGGVMGHAVRRGFACTKQTAAQWPWLTLPMASGLPLNHWKTLVDLDELYSGRYVACCRPVLLIFPRIHCAPHSVLTPLSALQTLTTLIGQPRSGLLVEPTVTPALLMLYETLAGQSGGYQLAAGADVFTAPTLVSHLLLQRIEATQP